MTTGTVVAVKFTNSNSVSQPRLNINGTGVKYIVAYNNYVPQTYNRYKVHPLTRAGALHGAGRRGFDHIPIIRKRAFITKRP